MLLLVLVGNRFCAWVDSQVDGEKKKGGVGKGGVGGFWLAGPWEGVACNIGLIECIGVRQRKKMRDLANTVLV
jgi:hypothetical protein